MVIAVRPKFGELQRCTRRPRNSDEMERQGWHFISERCIWDADQRELITKSIPALSQFWPGSIWESSDRWLKANVRYYVDHGRVIIGGLKVADGSYTEPLTQDELDALPQVLRPTVKGRSEYFVKTQ